MSERTIETIVGHVPASWSILTLENLAAFITKGGTPTTYGHDWADASTGIPFFRSECVTDNGFNPKGMNFISPAAHQQMVRSAVKPGDLLMTITGNVGRIAKAPADFETANINQHIARIRVLGTPEADTDYVYHCLKHDGYAAYYRGILTGQAYPQISLQQVRETPVAAPPMSERRKIAAILTAVDDKLDVIARQIEATQTLKQGLMQTLFSRGVGTQDSDGRWVPHTEFKDSELGEIPMGWEAIKLGSLVRSYAGGTPGRSNPDYFGGDVPWVKSGEVNRKTITYTEESITQLAVEKTSARVAEKGAILVAMYGATAGKVSRLMLDAAINQAILSIRSVSEKITNDFLYWLICNQTERMLAMCQGAAQPNLSKGLIESILVAVPDLHEQGQISKTLYAMEEKLDALADKHGQYQSLKRGLMQKLLTGEWRVKVDAELTA